MSITRKFTKTDMSMTFTSDAYTEDNGLTWRWVSNDSFCPLDACIEYGIPCDPIAQQEARDSDLAKFFAEYRANDTGPSDEDRYEARAAFGEGVELVNVITGRRWTT